MLTDPPDDTLAIVILIITAVTMIAIIWKFT